MILKRLYILVLVCGLSVLLTACQSEQVTQTVTEPETEIPALAVPYSKGPSAPPNVKGPSSLPPSSSDTSVIENDTPQAVSEVDEITITMPTGADAT